MVHYRPMDIQDIQTLCKAYEANFALVKKVMPDSYAKRELAIAATAIDFVRDSFATLTSRIESLEKSNSENDVPQPPDGNGDPDAIATEVCKTLGSLGLENLTELKCYRIDPKGNGSGKVLLQIRGRMADSGWKSDSPHFSKLKVMYETFGLPLTEIPQAETTVPDGESET